MDFFTLNSIFVRFQIGHYVFFNCYGLCSNHILAMFILILYFILFQILFNLNFIPNFFRGHYLKIFHHVFRLYLKINQHLPNSLFCSDIILLYYLSNHLFRFHYYLLISQ